MNKPDLRTVSNRIAKNCWHGLHAAGVSEAEFTGNTGIRLDELGGAGGRINADKHRRLTQFLQRFPTSRLMVDTGVAAWFADQLTLASLCFNSATLRHAIQRFLEFRGLVGEFDAMLMRENGSALEFEYISEFLPGQGGMQSFANFKSLAFVVRAYDPGPATAFQVGLQGQEPAFCNAMSEFFGAPVRFGQARNILRFDAPALDRPFGQFNALLAPHLLGRAQEEMRQIRGAHRFSAQVEQAIRELLAPAPADVDSASLLLRLCDTMRIAPWSLRRSLQQEETSFRTLEMKVKSEEAGRLLQAGSLSVAEISDRLGFSSQSAFTRFFKMHHHLPPVRYRQDAAASCSVAPEPVRCGRVDAQAAS
jgi:AraC-like DNA-binding protein